MRLSLPQGDFLTARQPRSNKPFGGPLSCFFILILGL